MPPETGTGVTLLVVEPSPSSPELLSPQQDADPVDASLQVCAPPVAIIGWTGGDGLVESLHAAAMAATRRNEIRTRDHIAPLVISAPDR